MPDEKLPTPNGQILLPQTEDGRTRIECRFQDETLWLTQQQLAEPFQVTAPTINEHLKGELLPASQTPSLGVMMKPEVANENETDVQSGVQA